MIEFKEPITLLEGVFSKIWLKFKYRNPDLYQSNDIETFIHLIPSMYSMNREGLLVNDLVNKGKVMVNALNKEV